MPTLERYLAVPVKPAVICRTYLQERVKDRRRDACKESRWNYGRLVSPKTNQYLEAQHTFEERTKQWSIIAVGARAMSAVEGEFQLLAAQWRRDIGAHSSLTKILTNWNYLKIIALGESAIPLILKELQREPAPWFVALEAITGEHNLGKQFAGNFRKMAAAWLAWGAVRGYL